MKMNKFKRTDRLSSVIQQAISEVILQSVRDPRVRGAVVTDVKVTADLSLARVNVRSLSGDMDVNDLLDGFNACSGFLRSEVSRKVRMLRVPKFEFFYDDIPEKAASVEKLLAELRMEGRE